MDSIDFYLSRFGFGLLRRGGALLSCAGIAFSLSTTRADIQVSAASGALGQSPNGENGTVYYYTPEGGHIETTTPGPVLTYRPDFSPGHQAFFAESQYTGSGFRGDYSAGAQTTVNAVDGTIRAVVGTTGVAPNPGATAVGKITDTLTFTNSSSSPVPITVKFRVSGSYGHNGAEGAEADHHMFFNLGGYFDLQGTKSFYNPQNDFDTVTFDGWTSQQVSRANPAQPAGVYVGTLMLPPGTSDRALQMFVRLRATNGGFAAFGNTAAAEIELPPSVTMRSASGVFLTSAFPRPANISTRGNVQAGDRVMIGGFIVNGLDSKKVVIRGLGPSLQNNGVSNTLPDPLLEVHGTDAQGKDVTLATNNNWKDAQATEIQNSGFAPASNLESAVILTLKPGNYTAIVKDQNGGAGNGLVEVYDLDAAANSSFANVSTRGFVGTGDNVLIGGVIVAGTAGDQAKLAVRALGPSLGKAGVAGALQDPTLTLYNNNGTAIAANDGWQETQAAAITNAQLAPGDDREAVIITQVAAGNYTAIVRGANNSTGIGLVEVYHLQ